MWVTILRLISVVDHGLGLLLATAGRTLIAWADAVLAYNATFDKGTTLLQTWNGDELGSTQVVQATARGTSKNGPTTVKVLLGHIIRYSEMSRS
jgi:hypothetical protein